MDELIHKLLLDLMTNAWPKFISGLNKPPSKTEHEQKLLPVHVDAITHPCLSPDSG